MPRDRRQRNRNIRSRNGPFPQYEFRLNRDDHELLRNQIVSLTSNIQIIADLLNIIYPLETEIYEDTQPVIIVNQQLSVTNSTLRDIRIAILEILLNRQSLTANAFATINPYLTRTTSNSYLSPNNPTYGYGNYQR